MCALVLSATSYIAGRPVIVIAIAVTLGQNSNGCDKCFKHKHNYIMETLEPVYYRG